MRKTLIVVDMQNDFIDMALGTKEAVAIVPKVRAKIEAYQHRGDEIIFTRDTHTEDYLNTPEGKKLPVPHCIRGTEGWQIADGLYVEGCKIIDKPNFGWPLWGEMALEEVELVGLCTDICVVSNALIIKATFPDADVKIYMTASAQERAKRRVKQLRENGENPDYAHILSLIEERDYRDSHRAASPLKPAEGAIIIDTSSLNLEQVIALVLEKISHYAA